MHPNPTKSLGDEKIYRGRDQQLRMDISVLGLGRLGSSFAASVAKSGIQVHGIDIDPEVVAAIEDGHPPFPEPQLEEYIQAAGDNLSTTCNIDEAVPQSDITFIFVNTYAEGVNGYSLKTLEPAVREVGAALADVDDNHTVVLRCTVMPGDLRETIAPWLEAESDKSVGEDIDLCYWPELTALGEIIESMEQPEFRLLGQWNEQAGDSVEAFVSKWIDEDIPLIRMGLTSAEVAKMAINTYVANKMSFVNGLSQICHGVGADVDDITEAMAADSRISEDYLTAGVRYGGPCFPHDNKAFEMLAARAETEFPLAAAADSINNDHTRWLADVINNVAPAESTVAILGMTYKPGVPVITESQGIELVRELTPEREIVAYDRIAVEETKAAIDSTAVTITDDFNRVLADADLAVITLPAGETIYDTAAYENIDILDPWRMLDAEDLDSSVSYYPLPMEEH
jgi:UDPglucose 6-dehydrogenase